jgi:hypothetical protein
MGPARIVHQLAEDALGGRRAADIAHTHK